MKPTQLFQLGMCLALLLVFAMLHNGTFFNSSDDNDGFFTPKPRHYSWYRPSSQESNRTQQYAYTSSPPIQRVYTLAINPAPKVNRVQPAALKTDDRPYPVSQNSSLENMRQFRMAKLHSSF